MTQNNETFYFIAYVQKRQALTVIDLAYSVDYEKDDWDVACNETFQEPEAAINYARKLATKYGLEYKPFDSRYNESLSERLYLTDDEIN